jgi:hypothetical protein
MRDEEFGGVLAKPAKGSSLIAGRERRKAARAFEDAQKDIVRAEDKRCRWPNCENCRRFKPRLEVAHRIAKGIGGDHGVRSTADQMILVDYLTHQGPNGIEQHGKRVDPLTDRGTRGPCEFWARDVNDQWYLVAREIAPFYYERD